MTFEQSIRTCISKYADFEGRASRSEYWWFALLVFVLSYIPFVGIIVSFAALLPSLAVGVRRLHDTGRCGWWILVPIANLVFLATEGAHFPNEYGPVPQD